MLAHSLDAIFVGELNIDLVLNNVPFPAYEEEKIAEGMQLVMGSSTAITAHNFSTVGGRAAFIGRAGRDSFGDFMVAQLAGAAVETRGIIRDPERQTGASVVLANPPRRAILTYPGAMDALTIDDVDWGLLAQARHVHVGGFFLQRGLRADVPRLFRKAKEMGLTTSLDTNWDPEDRWGDDLAKALEVTDIFLPNDQEALRITRTSTVADAAHALRERVRIVAIKCGRDGAVVLADGKTASHQGYSVPAVETTGAGDSFNAGFLLRFLQGGDLAACLRMGNACGALAVTAIGGTGAYRDAATARKKVAELLSHE
jgi:sugar/nucleoside kinase (ribokinase family)